MKLHPLFRTTFLVIIYFNISTIYAQKTNETIDHLEYLEAQQNKAILYTSYGNFDSAIIINKQIIIEATKFKYYLQKADAFINLSFLYQLQANYNEGLALADSAEILYAELKNRIGLANVLTTKAGHYNGLGLFNESIISYQKADSIYLIEKNDWSRSAVANNTGVTFFHQGDYRKAIAYFQKSLLLKSKYPVEEGSLLSKANIAEGYAILNIYDSAMAILGPSYITAKEGQYYRLSAAMAMLIGRIMVTQGNYEKAIPYLLEAQENSAADKSGIPYRQTESLMFLGIVAAKKNQPEQALKYLQQATTIARKHQVETVGWEAFYELGEFYYERKDFTKAIEAYKEAVEMIDAKSNHIFGGEDARKLYQNSGKKPALYAKLISSLSFTGEVDEAWAFAQKTQQEAIKELIGSFPINSNNAEKVEALQKLIALQQKRNGLDENIKKLEREGIATKKDQLKELQTSRNILEREYLNYVTELVKTYPEIDNYFSKNVNPEIFKNLNREIPDDMIIVLYLINGKQLLIFTATNKKIGVKELKLEAELEPHIDSYIKALTNPALAINSVPLNLRSTIKRKKTEPVNQKTLLNSSNELYNILIAPIEDEIKNYQSICIIPNGRLSNLPFQCIAKKINDSTGKFLIEDYKIFYANKLEFLKDKGRLDRKLTSFIGFGNPDKSLPSAGKEIEAIGKILNTKNIFLQEEATELKAKNSLENLRYVHFATHGVLDYIDPNSSYLQMSDVNNQFGNGELRIDEIKSLNIIDCELVTLSACETAVNQEITTGWYISPANSFLVNRVRSVVASLWAVDDDATNLLMQEFYKNITLMDKVEALRKAQATLSKIHGYQHPFYWGAFILYGDWR